MGSLHFIHDFSIILIVAGTMCLVSRLFKIPLLLGYIFGGMLLSGHYGETQFINDRELIHQLSELGIVFLMFYIGLEFDLKTLKRMFWPSFCALLFQTFFMFALGQIIAPFFGWGTLTGLFIGGLLTVSSTMVTLPILAEQKALHRRFAQLSIGVLILEDILAIMLLVVLSGIAITGHFEWNAVGRVTFLVGVFVTAVFFTGRMLAPILIRMLLRFNSEEILTLVIVGFLMAIGLLAECSHFSIALGAFLAGAIFSQTEISEAIEKHTQPIRSVFTAIFFVSIGLMVDLHQIWEYRLPILILTLLTFFMKGLACFLGLFLSGQKGEDSFRAACSNAQIGEFSFVIASLGISLNVVTPALLNIAVGVSLGSIFCTTFASPRSERFFKKIHARIPNVLLQLGNLYQNLVIVISTHLSRSNLLKVAKRPIIKILADVLLFSALLFSTNVATQWLLKLPFLAVWSRWIPIATWCIAAIFSLPLLVPTVRQINVLFLILAENALPKGDASTTAKKSALPNLSGFFQSAIFAFLLIIFGGAFLSVASTTLPKGSALSAFFLLLILSALLFWKKILTLNSRMESYFIESFNRNIETQIEQQRQSLLEKFNKRYPLNLDLEEISLKEHSRGCGQKICDLPLRTNFETYVIGLRRSKFLILSPEPGTLLFPNDTLILMAKPNNLVKVKAFFEQENDNECSMRQQREELAIEQICLGAKHELIGKTLIESNLRKNFGVSVVGICRNGQTTSLPHGNEILQPNDILIIVAQQNHMDAFLKNWTAISQKGSADVAISIAATK